MGNVSTNADNLPIEVQIGKLKAQIKAINKNISDGKSKNVFAARNKISSLLIILKAKERTKMFNDYLAL